MAAAQVLNQTSRTLEENAKPLPKAEPIDRHVDVRLAVHDTSRLEWAVSVPLPQRGEAHYAIEVDLEVPAQLLVDHSPWTQLQEFTRLDGPDDTAPSIATIDGLRRFAVGVAAKMARAHEGFGRHVRLALSPFAIDDVALHIDALEKWIVTAEQALSDARRRLASVPAQADVRREAKLVDEYLSLRLLELLAGSERNLATVYDHADAAFPDDPSSKRLAGSAPLVANVGNIIADALVREMDHRASAGYPEADADSPQGLEHYLDRASRLKKHFQEVLFLEVERFAVSDRFHHWAAAAAAVCAGTFAFVAQLYIARGSLSRELSSSLIALCVIAGVSYAVRDRIKDIGRAWFADNLHRFYGQRVARYRAPAKTCPTRDIIVRARESFLRDNVARPDPLNPDSGATISVTTLRYRHQNTLEACPSLERAGISRVKHVFRYDLSPLFARLDDATKPVPIYDAIARRVRFAQAPRCYRLPVRIVVRNGSEIASEQRGALIVHKRGLERVDLV